MARLIDRNRWAASIVLMLVACLSAHSQPDPIQAGSWTMAILPDTQIYAQSYPGGRNGEPPRCYGLLRKLGCSFHRAHGLDRKLAICCPCEQRSARVSGPRRDRDRRSPITENVEPERETCGQLGCGVRRPAHSHQISASPTRLLYTAARGFADIPCATTLSRIVQAVVATRISPPGS